MAGRHGAIKGRNAAAVRVLLRVPELGVNACFEAFGDEVLQPLRLFVQLIDFVVQDAVEECLDQAVVAHDLKRTSPAGGRQPHAPVTLIFHR